MRREILGKFCCFCCPAADYSEKSLDDMCPTCGRTYGFPLNDFPSSIQDYRILSDLGRGFYASTYVAERGMLGARVVLKVSPQSFFDHFAGKDFEAECRRHAEVARGTEHIVDIRDMFSATVNYDGTEIPCHIAELDFIEGRPLAEYFDPSKNISASTVAQIAIDLFRIREEFTNKGVNHNDLHAENIIVEELGRDSKRASAIDDSVRAVAIDLGSLSDESRSDPENERLGDLHWIGQHLDKLVAKLLGDPDSISDLDNRLANALQGIVHNISPSAENQRTPESADFIAQIYDAFHRSTQHWKPWRTGLSLPTFGASYNAQTMQAWHVPQLLVDPDGQWLTAMCSPGPQVITGMRGCGKTMLLRALQFHARASQRGEETAKEVLDRLRSDGYVGLFVSAQRLLDQLGSRSVTVGDPFARLFVAFGLEAVRAVHHLRDIDETYVSSSAYSEIGDAIGECLGLGDDMRAVSSEYELERKLNSMLISLSRGSEEYKLEIHPNIAFPRLDGALRMCSEIWQSAQILFLLDDVSTRYLDQRAIEDLLSALLFLSPTCAFKLTSEAQTIELGLKSPGNLHPAQIGRDLALFDLGAEVYEKIKAQGKGNGKDFLEDILQQRAEHFASHPRAKPSVLLGDVDLQEIAKEIGRSRNNSPKRKKVYRGITALARVCVGDIGDVISLYQQILKKAAGQRSPIRSEIQSECFQDFCARRLYDLNRRKGFLKDVAKSFAEASHELLVKSCNQKPPTGSKRRIRQYSSLYVKVTTGDIECQTERLRELIDAGVFVFAGGSTVPRTKTRDSNPVQQFKLTYRKIYGLVNFIGLAERDRFELSGKNLEEFLADPSKGKEILLRNLGGSTDDWDEEVAFCGEDEIIEAEASTSAPGKATQMKLFDTEELVPVDDDDVPPASSDSGVCPIVVSKKLTLGDVGRGAGLGELVDNVVLGLGFEKRSLVSARRVMQMTGAGTATVVSYEERGRSAEILQAVSAVAGRVSKLEYQSIIKNGMPEIEGIVLVDITGLAKPVIFHAIRNELRRKGRVWVGHTEAKRHYPLDQDLEQVLLEETERDRHALLEEVSEVLTGEEGPYELDNLLPSDADETRQRVLCAASSAKHERLLSLLDRRDYDRIEIIAPTSESSRSRVAQIAADVAASNMANSNVAHIGSNDLELMLKFVTEKYRKWYVSSGFNFELGLTGSKLQAVACSATSAAFKVSQCWYIRPRSFDTDRFTKGVGETHFFEIVLNPEFG